MHSESLQYMEKCGQTQDLGASKFRISLGRPEGVPERSKRSPEEVQEGSKRASGGVQGGPRGLQEGSKRAPGGVQEADPTKSWLDSVSAAPFLVKIDFLGTPLGGQVGVKIEKNRLKN